MKVKILIFSIFIILSVQLKAQSIPSPQGPTGLTFPNPTANLIVDLLRGMMGYVMAEIKKESDKKIKETVVIEENFEE
jgi:hypothetical protein